MTPEDSTSLHPSFLVAVNDPLVALDITTILGEAHPGARIATAEDRPSAQALLAQMPRLALAVVSLSPKDASNSDFGQALRRTGARLVLMGLDAEEHGEADGYEVLHRPFRTEDLLALISR